MEQHIVNFSGGKDSTAMLLKMIEKGMRIDRVICVDTTKEFPEMYNHIKEVQKLCPVEIEIIKIDFDYWLSEHVKTKGKNKGKKGYGWPDFRNRWCTALKRDTVKRIEKTLPGNTIQYHGIAFDEPKRLEKNKGRIIKYPLVNWKMTEKDCLEYCYSKGLRWGGVYEKFDRVSCYCCPLSRIGELRTLYNEYPELWDKMKEMDEKSYRKFRSNYTIDELEIKFEQENILI
jgi:3'-phosphoadenosine 5'-phosphosulfate sulfotransferase (PAPS reductase)/FAD synthetase